MNKKILNWTLIIVLFLSMLAMLHKRIDNYLYYVYLINVNSIKQTFNKPKIQTTIMSLHPVEQKALEYRIRNYKDRESIERMEDIVFRRNMDNNEILYSLANAALDAFPEDNLWKSRYLIGKLRKQGYLLKTDQEQLINHLKTNSYDGIRDDIYLYLCQYNKYKGTGFLKPYENLINDPTKNNGCKFP